MRPTTTYRIQFHKEFTFTDLIAQIPYLHSLGVDTVYASPIFTATPGSTHGYDGTDPLTISPEIGTEAQLEQLAGMLHERGMRWIQDFVPNHMAYVAENRWLTDVLKNGNASSYKQHFDLFFDDFEQEKLMLPFLGADLEVAAANGEVGLVLQDGALMLEAGGQRWPVNQQTLVRLRDENFDPESAGASSLKTINENTRLLLELIGLQYYRPCNWQETAANINYRRFFTVNSLICLNMQDRKVFDDYHRYLLQLIKRGLIQGVRIDHADGLQDPGTYLKWLREACGADCYIVIEKILARNEPTPKWPMEGTTGYDFLAMVNNLLTDREGLGQVNALYDRFTGKPSSPELKAREKKRLILSEHMQGEVSLLRKLAVAAGADGEEVAAHITALMTDLPRYRYYFDENGQSTEFSALLSVLEKDPESRAAAAWAKDMLEQADNSAAASVFFKRLMQFSGPVMAKGIEDTLMYDFARFIAHNEVGDSPGFFGIRSGEFVREMKLRLAEWPATMNATATHDTKRGEDFRSRLLVISTLPDEWAQWVNARGAAADIRREDLYFLYQTYLGSLPLPGVAPEGYRERLKAAMQKSLREGKVSSDWAEPDEQYEARIFELIESLPERLEELPEEERATVRLFQDLGLLNSLSQVLVKFLSPGIPDIYQGREAWDFSFVDPDNRSAVDYTLHASLLSDAAPVELWKRRYDGAIKVRLTAILSKLRRRFPDFFHLASFEPVELRGPHATDFFAFRRSFRQRHFLVLVPLCHRAFVQGQEFDPAGAELADTYLELPFRPLTAFNYLSGQSINLGEKTDLQTIFGRELPLAVIEINEKARGAGVLLPLNALPGAGGIGDMGASARTFVDWLHEAGQQYWQVLPLNPVDRADHYSPYSSVSSFAGNVLLIDLAALHARGLLPHAHEAADKADGPIDYDEVDSRKRAALETAFLAWKEKGADRTPFEQFCEEKASWLSDFALFEVLRELHGPSWTEWPADLRRRDPVALGGIHEAHADRLLFFSWCQYIFFEQWGELRRYARDRHIALIGDLPFYVTGNACDVWVNPGLFQLNEDYTPKEVAGVPPDAFSASGQRWGMPVFNWQAMKTLGYAWWMDRIAANLAMVDVLRLDHFRAFSAYWSIPAEAPDARAGAWQQGPGDDLFAALKLRFPNQPFIAEDLGEIDEPVYALRDRWGLSGMKVLQFGFSGAEGLNDHLPHEFGTRDLAVYTGTHDNNTSQGWLDSLGTKEREQLNSYLRQAGGEEVRGLIELAYASVAWLALVPVQDILGLGESARINFPGSTGKNWKWRLSPGSLDADLARAIAVLARRYGRIG
ncbi:4-alpha-glucanotransferase [Pedobacter yulinensis]|uniref:4-alpha-glucanotransferase n=1 Tax=Pedobacter yulinensis TaxID=2126353 RepID=A0A2T3HK89_9SPHI|nr:malto-oligosyltrehalose synthase [Pedobacter yulinensis]PST82840.1 4-alpha-glucanotransferase [Pedobacter yulinensis]